MRSIVLLADRAGPGSVVPGGAAVTSPPAAICGLGMTGIGRVFGTSPRELARRAVRLAAADAGLSVADLDGLLICPGISGGLDVGLAGSLGLRDLSLLAVLTSYGASACAAVQVASLAVASGSASAVACVFADTPLREGLPAGSAFGSDPERPGQAHRQGLDGLLAGYGYTSVTAHYAVAARRHMEAYGTTSEQLGAVAVAQRLWAAGNPLAQHREPVSLAEHQESRLVADPLHLLDCTLVSNGAVAIIVASAGRAAAGPRPPVWVLGWGKGHPGHPLRQGSEFGLVTGAAQAGRAAMTMAGVGPGDITMCQLYDCYTYVVLVSLEDYGFCRKGESGPFAASGALAPGGCLPVNTGGGQLSGHYMWGFTPLSEAVIQARGDGGERQDPRTDLILVSGNGGILAHHGTLILSPHRPDPGAVGRDAGARPTAHNGAGPAGVPATTPAGGPGTAWWAVATAGPRAATPTRVSAGQPLTASMGAIRADPPSAEFFAAAARGELLVRRCERCACWLSPSACHCQRCAGDGAVRWATVSGKGTLVSWAVTRSRQNEPVAVPALVELAEGPWLHTGLLVTAADLGWLRAGLPVTAVFEHPAGGESYPLFRPMRRPPA